MRRWGRLRCANGGDAEPRATAQRREGRGRARCIAAGHGAAGQDGAGRGGEERCGAARGTTQSRYPTMLSQLLRGWCRLYENCSVLSALCAPPSTSLYCISLSVVQRMTVYRTNIHSRRTSCMYYVNYTSIVHVFQIMIDYFTHTADNETQMHTRVARLRCTHPLRVSFQYNYRKADSIVLVSICGRLMCSTFQYISKLILTVSPGDLHTLSPAMARAYGGAAGNARQPVRGGRRHWLCRQSALWLEHWGGLRALTIS